MKSQKTKKKTKIIYDIIPPKIKEEIIFVREKTSLWLRAFYLFLKTSKYGFTVVFLMIILGGAAVWAIVPKTQTKTIAIYPTQVNGDIAENYLEDENSGWQNVENALGSSNILSNANADFFSKENSATYRAGPFSLILSDFMDTGQDVDLEELADDKFLSAKINFSFALGEENYFSELEVSDFEIIIPEEKIEIEGVEEIGDENIEKGTIEEEVENPEDSGLDIEERDEEIEKDGGEVLGEAVAEEEIIEESIEEKITEETNSEIKIEKNSESPEILESKEPEEEPVSFQMHFKDFFDVPFAKAQEGGDIGSKILEIEEEDLEFGELDIEGELKEIAEEEIEENILIDNLDTKIIIWYSLGDDAWQQLDIISGHSLSNASNGGYFNYEAPFIESWENLENLKIKFEGVVGGETNLVAYLDSVWVDVKYEKEKKNEKEESKITVISAEKDFKMVEEPEFRFKYKKEKEGLLTLFGEAIGIVDYWKDINLTAEIVCPNKKVLKIPSEEFNNFSEIFTLDENGEILMKLKKNNKFKPGLYKIILKIEENGETQIIEQDFTWGVLAINVNKSIYSPGEEAYLQMGVLRNDGHTICDASLELEIKNYESGIETILSTEDGTIQYSGKCDGNNVTDVPDYFAYYTTGETGTYEMKLTNLDNGYEIKDFFEVRESVPFEIERIGPTRIYPPADYEMVLKIKANQDFEGEIVEAVPEGFVIMNQELRIKNQESGEFIIHDSQFIIQKQENKSQSLIFQDLNLKTDNELEIRYTFNAPDVSPFVYLLGPLQIGDWQEIRQWQIAADNTTDPTHPSAYTLTTGFDGNFNETGEPASNAYSSNDEYASTDFNDKRNDEYTTNYRGFDFSVIPDGSNINSVNVYIERKVDVANGIAQWCSSVWADVTAAAALAPGVTGSIGDTQYNDGTNNPTSDTYWNYSMDPLPTTAQLKGTNFGIRVQIVNGNSGTDCEYFIDDIYIVVDYTPISFITVTGNVYTDEGSTAYDCSANNLTIGVSVNGGTTATGVCTLDTGAFSVMASNNPSATDDPVVVFIDSGESPQGTTVTLATDTTSNITGLKIYQNRIIVTSETATAVTNAKMSTGDNADAGIRYNVATGALTTETDLELHIFTGKTYTSGGSVTTQGAGGNLHLDDSSNANFEANVTTIGSNITIDSGATLTAPSSTLTITGNYANAGTFTHNSGTVIFNKGSATQTLNSGGTGTGKLFNNLTHSGAGTLQLLTNVIDVDGNFSQTSGIFDANSLNQNFAGNFSLSDTTTYTKGGTLTFDGTTSYNDVNSDTKENIGTVIINGTSVTLASSVTVDKMNVLTGILDIASSGYILTIAGSGTSDFSPFLVSGTLNEGTNSTVKFTGTSASYIQNETYYNLELSPSDTGSPTYTLMGEASEEGNGTPYKIDDDSNFGAIPNAGRQVVRDSSGNLYVVLLDDTNDDLEVWKSADGTSWTEQDSGNSPSATTASASVSVAIDSNDTLHIAYQEGFHTYYVTFASNIFGTPEIALTGEDALWYYTSTAIAVDLNDKPHVVSLLRGEFYGVYYSNKVEASWSTRVQLGISSEDQKSIVINEDNIPEVSFINSSGLYARVGNQNNATSFSTYSVIDSTANDTADQEGSDIAVDFFGNTWIAYVDETTNYITLAKHPDSQTDFTLGWTFYTNNNAGYEPNIAINETDIYIFYQDNSDNDIKYLKYDGSWTGPTTLATGTFQDVKIKWAYYNNNKGFNRIDYLYSDGVDIYWNELTWDSGGNFTTSNNFTIGNGTNTVTVTGETYDPNISVTGNVIVADNATFTNSDLSTATLNIDGDLTINSSGAFTAPAGTGATAFTLAGDFANSGTFTHNSGTMTFDGAGGSVQSISGNNTFYNFTATASSARTLYLAPSSTQTVSGAWTITGSVGELITLTDFICGTSTVTFTYKGGSVTYGTVNVSGQCFMDRNLGASQAATAYNDTNSYGDYFQWGRLDDLHQNSGSGTTTSLSSSSDPLHGNFIWGMGSPNDWVSPQIGTLWQSSSYVNNPCPSGWHVPLQSEWSTAMTDLGLASCSSDCPNSAANSSLKLPAAGRRFSSNAALGSQGTSGFYWSSSPNSTDAYILLFSSTEVSSADSSYRANGYSVRCLKN